MRLAPLPVHVFFSLGLNFGLECLRTNPWKFQPTITISRLLTLRTPANYRNRDTNKTKTKVQILKRGALRHPALISDITLMVRCCTNVCFLPKKTCEALFENRGENRDLEKLIGSKQCYYIMFTKQMWMKKRN